MTSLERDWNGLILFLTSGAVNTPPLRLAPSEPTPYAQHLTSRGGARPMLSGLTMDDYQLSLTPVVERAEQLSSRREVVPPARRDYRAHDHGCLHRAWPAPGRGAEEPWRRRRGPRGLADVEPAR